MEHIATVIKNVELGRLKNRLAGKKLVELEHCLIEILGELVMRNQLFKKGSSELARYCLDASSKDEFMSAYDDYSREKESWRAVCSCLTPVYMFFESLRGKLHRAEDKQISAGKAVTVGHARQLSVLVILQLEVMMVNVRYDNPRVQDLYYSWIKQ